MKHSRKKEVLMVVGDVEVNIEVVLENEVDRGEEVKTMDKKTNIKPEQASEKIKIGM